MTVATPPAPFVPSAPPAQAFPAGAGPEPYRLSVAQYHAMARHGIIKEGERVELLEGLLVRKMTIHQPHIHATEFLRDEMPLLFGTGFSVTSQAPITTTDSEPEPDIAVARGSRRFFLNANRIPQASEVILVAEVADSSLAEDRNAKQRIYARAEIPEYWIVNIPDRIVEVYTGPQPGATPPAYADRRDYAVGDEVPVSIGGAEVGRVRVAELFR